MIPISLLDEKWYLGIKSKEYIYLVQFPNIMFYSHLF